MEAETSQSKNCVPQDLYDRVEDENVRLKKVMAQALNDIHQMTLPNIAKEKILNLLIPESS
jgi:hypothetical protein